MTTDRAPALPHPTPDWDAAADLQRSLTLLDEVKTGKRPGPVVRLRRPGPTIAFGQRDQRLSGFPAAVEAATRLGYQSAVRKVGGQAAGYHPGSLIFDHIQAEPDAMLTFRDRYVHFGTVLTEVFASLGITAHVGELPDEYCAGEYSMNIDLPAASTGAASPTAPARTKVVGTAQRVVSGAWLYSASIIVTDSSPLREVITAVYQDLDLPLDPSTVGALNDAVPTLTVDDVAAALLNWYDTNAPEYELIEE